MKFDRSAVPICGPTPFPNPQTFGRSDLPGILRDQNTGGVQHHGLRSTIGPTRPSGRCAKPPRVFPIGFALIWNSKTDLEVFG